MKTSEMLDAYLTKTMPVKTEATIKYERILIHALKNMIKEVRLDKPKKLTFDDGFLIVKYFKEKTSNKNNSINKYMNYLVRVLKNFKIDSSLYDFPKLPADTIHFKRINNDDLKRIIKYVRDLDDSVNTVVYRAMVYVLLDSGVRLTELTRIKCSNVDFTRMLIRLDETKNHQSRFVPFSEFSRDELKTLIQTGPKRIYVFWNMIANRVITREDAKNFFRRMTKKLGIENVHAHRFRKTFATKLRENGARLEAIQYLLGHSRLSTTMIYVEQTLDMTIEEYRKFNKWEL